MSRPCALLLIAVCLLALQFLAKAQDAAASANEDEGRREAGSGVA